MIAVGSRLPELTFFTMVDGAPGMLSTAEVFAGKTVALFAVPGPFTPGCTQQHLPGFAKELASFKAKGVDTVACVAVSDAFVMQAWKQERGVADELVMLGTQPFVSFCSVLY